MGLKKKVRTPIQSKFLNILNECPSINTLVNTEILVEGEKYLFGFGCYVCATAGKIIE